jgi:hypothetical protein
MSDQKINIDLSDAVLVFGIFALIILCVGEPDLLDAIIHRLMH